MNSSKISLVILFSALTTACTPAARFTFEPGDCERAGVSEHVGNFRPIHDHEVVWKKPIKAYWWNIDKLCSFGDPSRMTGDTWGCTNFETGTIYYTGKEGGETWYHEMCHMKYGAWHTDKHYEYKDYVINKPRVFRTAGR